MPRSALLVCALSCGLLSAFPALADEPASGRPSGAAPPAPTRILARRLEYTLGPGAEACPDNQGLAASVAANVGYDPFQPGAPLRLIATITRQGNAYVALMEERAASGAPAWAHPPLPDVDCRNLVRIMGISIAIAIDPFPKAPQAPAPPPVIVITTPALSAPPPLPPPPVADKPQPPPALPSPRPKVRLGLGAAAEMGIAPSTVAGFSAQVGVRWRLASLSAEARVDLPALSDATTGPQVRSMLVAGSLVPCGHIPLPLPLWNVAGCGVVTLGVVRAERLDVPVSGSGFYAGAGARVALEIPVGGPVALRVSGDVLGSVKPTSIQILHGQGVMTTGPVNLTTAPVTGGLGGGVVADF